MKIAVICRMDNDGYRAISDYAYIGNGRTAALISLNGSIDWLCWPRFDSPSLFGALLDKRNGGYWSITPVDHFTSTRQYIKSSLVLKTTFTCQTGIAHLIDCMPIDCGPLSEYPDPEQEICRYIECISGKISIRICYQPASGYGSQRNQFKRIAKGLILQCKIGIVLLRSNIEFNGDGIAEIEIQQGQSISMSLVLASDGPAVLRPLGEFTLSSINCTIEAWTRWSEQCTYNGKYKQEVLQSALVLKSLIYAPSGAVVAAATTSLPEHLFGNLNWDYRFCWLRDASLTMRALKDLGFHKEATAFASWLLHTTRLTRPRLQPLYDVFGGLTHKEIILSWLDGYKNSKPVRIGNAASQQLQLDIYGELITAVVQTIGSEGCSDRETKKMLLDFGLYICEHWNKPDEGIWEPREPRTDHTASKVLSWAGLRRLLDLQDSNFLKQKYHSKYSTVIKDIENAIENRGFNSEIGAYTQSFQNKIIDISILLMGWHGYKSPSCKELQSTFREIKNKLYAHSGLFYRNEQSIIEKEGAFGICSFWVAEFLAKGGGTLSEAEKQFENVLQFKNDVGLYSEEIDPETGDFLGNFPQAFTHIGLINAALSIEERRNGTKT